MRVFMVLLQIDFDLIHGELAMFSQFHASECFDRGAAPRRRLVRQVVFPAARGAQPSALLTWRRRCTS